MSDFNLQTKGLFGRYCRIEMFRYGVPNEFYIHKIVSQNRTNTYCDVPLRWDSKPEKHEAKVGVPFPDNLEEVIWVVQCGIDETKVFPVALKDVELLGEDFNEGCEFQKVGSDGYPFCASSTEIMRLRDENAKLRELVRDYDKVLDDAVYVWGTVADFLGYGRKYDALHDRMRDLGIEVDA